MDVALKKLSFENIDASTEIQSWLNQFQQDKHPAAINLLSWLRFVPIDTYTEWLKETILGLEASPCALFSVRKMSGRTLSLWNRSGRVISRPGKSQGSEDLVCSVISGLYKLDNTRFLDHPDLAVIRYNRIRHVVLIDDSIGSGARVVKFLKRMTSNKTFLSWWSSGYIKLHIVAFCRTVEAETRIIESLPGSNHHARKFPKTNKVSFRGQIRYAISDLMHRWGPMYQDIHSLCRFVTPIPRDRRLGYGEVMGNVVFYHSVPNNIPGMLWCRHRTWKALFPGRGLPTWVATLLGDGVVAPRINKQKHVSELLLELLRLVQKGIRSETSLGQILGLDITIQKQLMLKAVGLGLMTNKYRITRAGANLLRKRSASTSPRYNRELYIPLKWCVGQGTV